MELTLTYPIVIKPPSDVVEEIGVLIYDWAVSEVGGGEGRGGVELQGDPHSHVTTDADCKHW